MNNLNSVLIEGSLTRDPELSYAPTGGAICDLTVCNTRYFRPANGTSEQETVKDVSTFTCRVYGRQAEICEEYLKKGRSLRIVGRLRQERWTSESGDARERVSIVAEHVEFRPERKERPTEPETEQEEAARERESAATGG